MALLKTTLLTLLAGGLSDEPDYPLGTLRSPPLAEPAHPFRLVDLGFSFADDGRTVSNFDTRVRVGAGAFIGGEVAGQRRGLFFDTQRIETAVTEEDGTYEIEGSYRAPWFLLGVKGLRQSGTWLLESGGSVRVSDDLELLLAVTEDLDDSRFTPGSVEEFAASGELPPPAPAPRELASRSLGFLYQRASRFELEGEARWSTRRTEASFDLDVERYRLGALVHRAPFQLDGSFAVESMSGRLDRTESVASLGADVELGKHFLARADTLQRWEPGALRFEERYRAGLTFFGRRHRFQRSSDVAPLVEALQKRVNDLGYNERRVYDLDGIRRLRERIGVSSARAELAAEIDELYRAQVRDRNVPQLGLALELADDALHGFESRGLRAFAGVPWKPRWPFSKSEASVEFVSFEVLVREDRYSSGVESVTYEVVTEVFLNREMVLRFEWERPGVTPAEIALGASRPDRFTVSYEYALGR